MLEVYEQICVMAFGLNSSSEQQHAELSESICSKLTKKKKEMRAVKTTVGW